MQGWDEGQNQNGLQYRVGLISGERPLLRPPRQRLSSNALTGNSPTIGL